MVKVKISDNLIISELIEITHIPHDISTISKELNKVASTVDTRINKINTENLVTTTHSGLECTWVNDFPIMPDLESSRKIYLFTKRAMDIIISGLALIILSPILLFTALIIKLTDNGSILFVQKRVGYNNKQFDIYKFRTMHHHRCDRSGVEQTKIDDCRVSQFGKFLRKTSIDELPQLFNILKGEMSLIGPRPLVKGELASGRAYKEIVPYYDLRHSIVPGLTGWSQINGFRTRVYQKKWEIEKIEHDIAYIQNMSLWLDIKILFLTVKNEFFTGSGH